MVYLGHWRYCAKPLIWERLCRCIQWTSQTYAYPIWSLFFKERKRAWNKANYENTCITRLGWTIHTHGVKRIFKKNPYWQVWVSSPMHWCEGLEFNLKLGKKYCFWALLLGYLATFNLLAYISHYFDTRHNEIDAHKHHVMNIVYLWFNMYHWKNKLWSIRLFLLQILAFGYHDFNITMFSINPQIF